MRLTLRTLLAYLDDTLDASQVKKIGQKVAESDTAQELIARIREVTRRGLTTPVSSEPGDKLDANTIAEYLENALTEDEVAEVEQFCLGSDVHLAELSACHQLLTLILGEPMLIPPTSRQRMYGLVQGREAIPFRKPPASPQEEEPAQEVEKYETDESLRMGLPAFGRRKSVMSRLTFIAGALAACALLVLAIFQALKAPNLSETDQNGQQVADAGKSENGKNKNTKQAGTNGDKGSQADKEKDKTPAGKKTPVVNGNGKKTPGGSTPKGPKKDGGVQTPPKGNGNGDATPPKGKGNGDKTPPKDNGKKPPKGNGSKTLKLPESPKVEPPNREIVVVGEYLRNDPDGSILFQEQEDDVWRLIDVMEPKVRTGARLVSLPGFKSFVSLKNDALQMALWGTQQEEVPYSTASRESMVRLHENKAVDLDFTLLRGKVMLSLRQDAPTLVRFRFENPTDPAESEVWDLILKEKGTEVFIERFSWIPPGEPYFPNPDNKWRKGPIARVHLVVREGKVLVRRNLQSVELSKAPGDAGLMWESTLGFGKVRLEELPVWASDKAELPADTKLKDRKQYEQIREKLRQARKKLFTDVVGKDTPLDVILTTFEQSGDVYERTMAVRSYGALDKLSALRDALGNRDNFDVRRAAIDVLRKWVSYQRDNDYQLFEALTSQKNYTETEAESILTMLHGFSAQDAQSEAIYEALIPKLNHDKIALRDMAMLQLYFELPRYFPESVVERIVEIKYSPDAMEEVRRSAVTQWQSLYDMNLLPPVVEKK